MTGHRATDQWRYEPPTDDQGRRRRLILTSGVLVTLLASGAVLLSIYTDDDKEVPAAQPTATTTMEMPIRDGPIEFFVQSINRVETSPGPEPDLVQVIEVRLTNTGASPRSISPQDQRLINDGGREYRPATLFTSQLTSDLEAIALESGETAIMTISFRVPSDVEPVAVLLRTDPLSPGVVVKLPQ